MISTNLEKKSVHVVGQFKSDLTQQEVRQLKNDKLNCYFSCPECQVILKGAVDYAEHLRHIHPEFVCSKWEGKNLFFCCPMCTVKIGRKSNFYQHLNIHSSLRFFCPECHKESARNKNFQRHLKKIHFFTATSKIVEDMYAKKLVKEGNNVENKNQILQKGNNVSGYERIEDVIALEPIFDIAQPDERKQLTSTPIHPELIPDLTIDIPGIFISNNETGSVPDVNIELPNGKERVFQHVSKRDIKQLQIKKERDRKISKLVGKQIQVKERPEKGRERKKRKNSRK